MKESMMLISILLIIAFILSSTFLFSFQELAWDEAHYLKIAEYWYNHNPVFKEFFLQPQPHFRVLNFSPLLSFIEYLIYLIFGINLFVVKFVFAFFLPLLVFGVFKLVSLVDNHRSGLIASGFILINQTISFWSSRLYTDIPAIALLIFGLYFFMKGTKENYKKNYFLAGIIFGVSFLMRTPLIVIGAGIVSIYLILNRKLDGKIIFLLSFILPLIPWLIYSQIEFGNFLDGFSIYYNVLVEQEKSPPLKSLTTFINSVDVVWLLLFAIGFLAIRKINDIRIIAVILSLFVFLITPFADVRYAIPSIVFGSLVASKAAQEISRVLPFNLILLIILIFMIFLNVPSLIQHQKENVFCSENSAAIRVSDYLKNTEKDTIVFTESFWPQIEFYSKRDTYGMIGETAYLDYLIKENRTRYIITLSEKTPIKYLDSFELIQIFKDNCRTLYLYGR